MEKTIFKIPEMDCPAEESLIRLKLDGVPGVVNLDFDLPHRELTVYHTGPAEAVERAIAELNLGGRILTTSRAAPPDLEKNTDQKKLLGIVLAINFGFFLLEMTTGWLSNSMGLIADSLDMLADAFVYGISLLAVGGSPIRKKRIARTAGYFQIILAVAGFSEVLRRFLGHHQNPDYTTMILISVLALLANGICLVLLQRSKSKEEAHMKASMIFTSNDVIINLGVILAGIMVNWLNSNKPDLIIGTLVFALVIQGALRILKLGK
jgi:Co/Zn/Cd efflux system component/copper chaperone CopZ